MKNQILEIYYLRAFGCLAVWLYHLLGRLIEIVPNDLASLLYIPASIGTPIFVFISIFLLSTFYFNKALKDGFLQERAKYILLPYFCYGFFYASLKFVQDVLRGNQVGFVEVLIDHWLLAHWHGYFLLIIFQFILMFLVQRKFQLVLGLKHVIASVLISGAYWLAEVNEYFVLPGHLSWVLIFGWLYVYCLGFYFGNLMSKHIAKNATTPLLVKNKKTVYLGYLVAIGAFIVVTHFGLLELRDSKNVWAMLVCIMTIVVAFYIEFKPINLFVRIINRYSFSIYLAHPLILGLMHFVQQKIQLPNMVYMPLLMLCSILIPIFIGYVANKVKYGPLVFGKKLNV